MNALNANAKERERLARIAATTGKKPSDVRIYRLDNGGQDWPFWLCSKHLADRLRHGWSVKEEKDAPHSLDCDDRNRGPCS